MNVEESIRHDCFVRLLTCHSRRIFGFILSQSPRWTDAEDIFQETSVALWKKFDAYQEGLSFFAWACGVARLEVLNHRRKHRQTKDCFLLSDEALQVLAQDALAAADDMRWHEEALARCLEVLKARDRLLIERRYFRAESPKQIAEDTAQPVYAVYRALGRVHERLMRCVRRRLAGDPT